MKNSTRTANSFASILVSTLLLLALLALPLIIGPSPARAAGPIYVSGQAVGANNGTS